MKKIVRVIIALLLAILPLSGCSKKIGTITVTCYPIQYLVEQIVGDSNEVVCLSEDSYIQKAQIRSDYDEILSSSDVLIYISELESYMNEYAEKMHNYHLDVIDLSELSSLCNFARYTTYTLENKKIVTESPYYDNDLFDEVITYNRDPFIWLEPIAASSLSLTVKDYLCSKYPENTLIYENNFKTLQTKLVRMDVEYQALKSLNVKIVSVGANFGVWQKSYGVTVYPIVISKDGSLPTDEQLEYMISMIKTNKVKYIVNDDTLLEEYQEVYEKVLKACSLKAIDISSLSILSENDKKLNKDYMTIMYENLTNLEKAFK